jgi:Predicted membrane protein (DUF2254)
MIGVAGVTFSIAIAAVIQAAQNFGPRLIVNFMRDRGNQVVLGHSVLQYHDTPRNCPTVQKLCCAVELRRP